MLEIEKYVNENNYYTFYILTDDGKFEISFQNNLDLYWRYIPEKSFLKLPTSKEFAITKENYYLYTLFEKLYNSIKNIESYPNMTLDSVVLTNYQHLFKNNYIKWYSDDFSVLENASCLIIKKINDTFKIIFNRSKTEPESGLYFETYSVRICNSGSRYKPFNFNFMKMYHNLKEYDPDYHQIHLEECLYNQKKVKK